MSRDAEQSGPHAPPGSANDGAGAGDPDAPRGAADAILRARIWLIPVALVLALVLLTAAPLLASVLALSGQQQIAVSQTLRVVGPGVLLFVVTVLAFGGFGGLVVPTRSLAEGQALLERAAAESGATRAALLRQSADVFRAAMARNTLTANQRLWASAANGRGRALRQLSEDTAGMERVQLAAEATNCFRIAANTFARLGERGNWAAVQNNLGAALSSQASGAEGAERARLLAEAVAAHQQALRERSRRGELGPWADAMSNLGVAFGKQADMVDGAARIHLLRASVEAHRAVVETPGPISDHVRMLSENNMGASLMRLATSVEGEERLRLLAAAVGAYRQALGANMRERFPTDWARTQHNVAGALTHWAQEVGDTERVLLASEAVLACQEALRVRSRATSPAGWAGTMNNLAFALRVQAEGTHNAGERSRRLSAAVNVCRQALEVAERGSQPGAWAELHSNLGSAFLCQAEMASGAERARLAAEASAACRAALGVMSEAADPFDHRRVLGDLRRAEALLA